MLIILGIHIHEVVDLCNRFSFWITHVRNVYILVKNNMRRRIARTLWTKTTAKKQTTHPPLAILDNEDNIDSDAIVA